MATVTPVLTGEDRILLNEVSWEAYEALLKSWAELPGRRLTYDHGKLEIISPLHSHEQYASLIGRFIETFTEELQLPIHTGRSTTCRRKQEERGLEPDEC